MTGDIAIDVRGLRYVYDTFTAVAGVDLTVRRGEVFALLGTNGAGKTTTLELIEGFRRPAAGEIRVLGHDPYRARNLLKPKMGVMLQQAGLLEELTTAETLRMWGSLSSRDDDVDDLLDTVELAHRRDTRVEQLSGGEKRRLDFALAVYGRPELIVLNEPTTGLDPESRQRLWKTVAGLRDGGATVLLTTHYLEEAEHLADRVAIMHQGEVSVAGTLAEVLDSRPARISVRVPFTALDTALPSFAGALTSTVESSGAVLVLETTELQRDLTALLRWAEDGAVPLRRLSATQASLSDIFHTIGSPS